MNQPFGATKSQAVLPLVVGEGEAGGGVAAVSVPTAAAPSRPEPDVVAQRGGIPFTPPVRRGRSAHRHTTIKAGMPVPRCSCGAIQRQDRTWHLETRGAQTEDGAPIQEPDDEW
jgi:hypothetical protein